MNKTKDLNIYKRNKNILLEGIEGTILEKIGSKIFNGLNTLLRRRVTPVFSERVVEYPLLFQYLRRGVSSILDFGCVEDLLPIHLASLGYIVTGLDFRPYPFTHDNFTFINTDILQWKAPSEMFDTVVSISTIEHVGLGSYGDPAQSDGDKVAVSKLWQALKTGGDMLVTVPAGKSFVGRGMRVYNPEEIARLIPSIETVRYFSKNSRAGQWKETDADDIADFEYESYYSTMPIQGVAFVAAKKKNEITQPDNSPESA